MKNKKNQPNNTIARSGSFHISVCLRFTGGQQEEFLENPLISLTLAISNFACKCLGGMSYPVMECLQFPNDFEHL